MLRRLNPTVLLAVAVMSGGCGPWAGQWENWGNIGKHDEKFAKFIAPQPFVYEYVTPQAGQPFAGLPGQAVEVEGRTWVAAYGSVTVPQQMLRSVSGGSGVALYALSWDNPPYDRLYATGQNGQLVELR